MSLGQKLVIGLTVLTFSAASCDNETSKTQEVVQVVPEVIAISKLIDALDANNIAFSTDPGTVRVEPDGAVIVLPNRDFTCEDIRVLTGNGHGHGRLFGTRGDNVIIPAHYTNWQITTQSIVDSIGVPCRVGVSSLKGDQLDTVDFQISQEG